MRRTSRYDDSIIPAKDFAGYFITSKERAEDFIRLYKERHHVDRSAALRKLKSLGIQLSLLPDKR